MGLLILIIGLVVFLGAHTFVTFRDRRAAAIATSARAMKPVPGSTRGAASP